MIPTLSGYVTKSKVVSANVSASYLRKNMDYFLFELSTVGKGMKVGDDKICQIMFMCKNGKWQSKMETKPYDKKNNRTISDSNGSYVFNDHTHWWISNQNQVLLDTTTRDDPNHLLALTRVVADTLPDVNTAFIMAFFSNSKCDVVIYIRDCDYVWPNKRACIVNNPNDGKRRGMTEFWPYKGTWPDSANELIWNGQQGVDMDGFIVGTCPVIEFKART